MIHEPFSGQAIPIQREGRGIHGLPSASASLYGLRPQTVLRRTIDPSPYLRSVEPNTARPGLGGFGAGVGMTFPPKPSTPLAAVRWGPPSHADVKRGSRSRARQSAAEGGGAKRWLERDREPLFHPRAQGAPYPTARKSLLEQVQKRGIGFDEQRLGAV